MNHLSFQRYLIACSFMEMVFIFVTIGIEYPTLGAFILLQGIILFISLIIWAATSNDGPSSGGMY